MKRLTLIVAAAAAALYGALAAPTFQRASTAYAQQCNGGNCTCIIECPRAPIRE